MYKNRGLIVDLDSECWENCLPEVMGGTPDRSQVKQNVNNNRLARIQP